MTSPSETKFKREETRHWEEYEEEDVRGEGEDEWRAKA